MPFIYADGTRSEAPLRRRIATPVPREGPGTELKKLLARIGIEATKKCKCNAMAAKMNREGEQWCLDHISEIIDVMEQEAKRRKLPFLRIAGAGLVRLAIRNARKLTATGVQLRSPLS